MVYTCMMTQMIQQNHDSPALAAQRHTPLDDLLEPAMLRALAEPTRARLLSCLLKCARPCSVTEVAECCSIDFSMVSRHLATMAQAGLLHSEKRGRTVWYRADAAELAERCRLIASAIEDIRPAGACCPAPTTPKDDRP